MTDDVKVRIRGKHTHQVVKGSIGRTLSEQRSHDTSFSKTVDQQDKEAKRRLKQLQKIEDYRAQKVQKEMEILEFEHRLMEQERENEIKKEEKHQKYLAKQKARLDKQRSDKMRMEHEKKKKKDKEEKKKAKKVKQKEKYYDNQKKKINRYKQQIEENIDKMCLPDSGLDSDDDLIYAGLNADLFETQSPKLIEEELKDKVGPLRSSQGRPPPAIE